MDRSISTHSVLVFRGNQISKERHENNTVTFLIEELPLIVLNDITERINSSANAKDMGQVIGGMYTIDKNLFMTNKEEDYKIPYGTGYEV